MSRVDMSLRVVSSREALSSNTPAAIIDRAVVKILCLISRNNIVYCFEMAIKVSLGCSPMYARCSMASKEPGMAIDMAANVG